MSYINIPVYVLIQREPEQYKNITSGAQSDFEAATKLARAIVTRWGFSEELGTVTYGENQEEVFLGYTMGRQQIVGFARLE